MNLCDHDFEIEESVHRRRTRGKEGQGDRLAHRRSSSAEEAVSCFCMSRAPISAMCPSGAEGGEPTVVGNPQNAISADSRFRWVVWLRGGRPVGIGGREERAAVDGAWVEVGVPD